MNTNGKKLGKLWLIPTPLGEENNVSIPTYVIDAVHKLDHFIVERAKTARHWIKSTRHPKPLPALVLQELNEHTQNNELDALLQPLREGLDVGLLSEAGCPGVADPGAAVVALAHREGIEVLPLVGPSSILLALMGSGMNGQHFTFRGYLSAKRDEVGKQIKQIEQQVIREHSAQIFIETPYRNQQMMEALLAHLQPQTKVCIAVDLSLSTQLIRTMSVAQWKKQGTPDLHKRPTVFVIGN
jgi:16S rRNA (cytidine1402-2'-O)-methyltransferase